MAKSQMPEYPLRQATGPPRQATGLPRSGAVEGVGMLRGTGGGPLLDFFGFRDLSRFHHRRIPFLFKKTWEKPIVLDPRKIQKYSTICHSCSKYV